MSDNKFSDFPDLNKLFEQAQKMQEEFSLSQEELAKKHVETSVGGGMVTVVFSGTRDLLSIKIDPQVIDSSDPGMLQDLILAAINQGLTKVKSMEEDFFRSKASALNLPLGIP